MSKALKAVLKVEEALTAWEERAVAPASAYTASKLLLETIPSLIGGATNRRQRKFLFSYQPLLNKCT